MKLISSNDFLSSYKKVLEKYNESENYELLINQIEQLQEINKDIFEIDNCLDILMKTNIEYVDLLFNSFNLSSPCEKWIEIFINLFNTGNIDVLDSFDELLNCIVQLKNKGVDYKVVRFMLFDLNYSVEQMIAAINNDELISELEGKMNSNVECQISGEEILEETPKEQVIEDNLIKEAVVGDNTNSMDMAIALIQNSSNNEVLKALDQMSHMILVIRDRTTSAFNELSSNKSFINSLSKELKETKKTADELKIENEQLKKELEAIKSKQKSINNLLNEGK